MSKNIAEPWWPTQPSIEQVRAEEARAGLPAIFFWEGPNHGPDGLKETHAAVKEWAISTARRSGGRIIKVTKGRDYRYPKIKIQTDFYEPADWWLDTKRDLYPQLLRYLAGHWLFDGHAENKPDLSIDLDIEWLCVW